MNIFLPILYASLVVGATATILAVVLLVAEKLLINYGPCDIDVNGGREKFQVTGGQTLLKALKDQGVFIPSSCGGRGTCGTCKVKVLSGGGPIAPTETPLLTADEIADNVRISCQVKVRNDLAIEIPDELFSVRQFRGTVGKITDQTHDIKLLRIVLDDPKSIDFTPGQYVQLETPAYGKNPEPVYRAYSLASSPDDAGAIDLIIRLVPDGICTTWVFTRLVEGDEVTFNGPYGEFRLSETDREMIWIAGGSGMAPFRSILQYMKAHGISRKTRYFFGAVSKRDLFMVDELTQLAQELDWFEFIPALSNPAEGDAWEGETGLITEVVARHVENEREQEAYLCGSPGMIDASIKVLNDKGITDDRIFYDKFA